MGRNLIVGDIHGCLDKLKSVLELAGFCDDDTLYFTGDICDRGPKPLDTLRFLMSLHSFKPVLETMTYGCTDISSTMSWMKTGLEIMAEPSQ